MQTYPFVTLDVFTDRRFGGNPLAVFPDARGLSDGQMQALAREFNLSETTFVLPPADPAHTARVRIFTPGGELPFAGHPNVGTGVVLAGMGRDRDGVLLFEETAGLVEVRVERDAAGVAIGAVIAAPQPLSRGTTLSAAAVAACAGLRASDVLTAAHEPVVASVGTKFVLAEIGAEALARAAPDLAGFRATLAAVPELEGKLGLHLYARDGLRLRTRMFGPLMGVPEDPATGSANATLAALLLSLGDAADASYEITQGVEMGRPSLLHATARRGTDGIRATIGGRCVPVLRGEALA
jgi:trans-2,3-dihydro-3-hydroxyanthranilate isomerase